MGPEVNDHVSLQWLLILATTRLEPVIRNEQIF